MFSDVRSLLHLPTRRIVSAVADLVKQHPDRWEHTSTTRSEYDGREWFGGENTPISYYSYKNEDGSQYEIGVWQQPFVHEFKQGGDVAFLCIKQLSGQREPILKGPSFRASMLHSALTKAKAEIIPETNLSDFSWSKTLSEESD